MRPRVEHTPSAVLSKAGNTHHLLCCPKQATHAICCAVPSRHGLALRLRCHVYAPSKHVVSDVPQTGQQLLEWARSSGGVVHASLAVTDDAPCGCRGVVAASDITASSCQALWGQHSSPPEGPNGVAPLIAVPEQLCMTSEDAHELLSQVLTSAADPAAAVTTKRLSGSTHTAPTNSTTRPASLLEQAASSFGLLLGLTAAGGQRGILQQRLRQLQPPMLLALLLAQQRRLGPQSFWHAYIRSLPERPPCAWFDAVEQQLLRPATSTQETKQEQQWLASAAGSAGAAALDASTLAAAASAVAAKCRAAADVFGAALGGVSAAEIAWAYGQVVSRAFATGPPGTAGIALLPVIDMLNHAAGAAVPVCWLREAGAQQQEQEQRQQDGATAGVGGDGGLWCVWRQQLSSEQDADLSTDGTAAAGGGAGDGGSSGGVAGGESKTDPVVLCAGQELYISYMSSCDAASAYLSFGFVPPEIQLEA